MPTTTEEDIYDYDLNTAAVTEGENYETDELILISTTSMSIEQTSTTMKSIDEISKTSTKAEEISFVDDNKDENDKTNEYNNTIYISKKPNSTGNVSKQETGTIAIATTEAEENNNNRLKIQKINAVDLSTDETSSTDEGSTENSTPTLRAIEPIINELGTTESTANSLEGTIIIKNDLSIDVNRTESNSIEVDFIDVSIEDSSTMNPRTVDDSTTIIGNGAIVKSSAVDNDTEESSVVNSASTEEPSVVDNRTSGDSKSDSSTTLTPVFTEQVVVSVI